MATSDPRLQREEWSASYQSIRIDYGDPLEIESSKEEKKRMFGDIIACLGMLMVWSFHRNEEPKEDVDTQFMAEEEGALLSFWGAGEDRVQREADRLRSISYYI